jgi:hypothetical protein
LLLGGQWEASPSDLEADSEASLLRAGPKDPASRMCPILQQRNRSVPTQLLE